MTASTRSIRNPSSASGSATIAQALFFEQAQILLLAFAALFDVALQLFALGLGAGAFLGAAPLVLGVVLLLLLVVLHETV